LVRRTPEETELVVLTSIINTTSKALATSGEDFAYYLNESSAMQVLAEKAALSVVRLPATKEPRQSTNVQLPTAILRNLSMMRWTVCPQLGSPGSRL